MRRPKTELVLGGQTMVQRQIRLLGSVCRSVAVLGPPEKLQGLPVPVFADDFPDRGPLAGIYTGLRRSQTEFNLFVSCDMPFLEVRFLPYLCQRALDTEADVTVLETRGQEYQPLCAVYRRRAPWAIRTSLVAGENKVSRCFSRVCGQVIPWREIARAGFAARIFVNMNALEEYDAARRRF